MGKPYCKRVWLNHKPTRNSGSVVAYCGPNSWNPSTEEDCLLEVSDCAGKITLHRTNIDSTNDFIRKIRALAKVANDFANFLENR